MAVEKRIKAEKNKSFLFEVRLDWLTGDKGILTSNEVKDTIRVAMPEAFGGESNQWSPEHLFIASVSSCFMVTYLSFAKKMGFNISHFESHATGQIKIIDGHYQFTDIDVYPKIFIEDEVPVEKALEALKKTEKYCIVSNSVKSHINYHGEILPEKHISFYKGLEDSQVVKK